jgi:hypothetical protein
MKSRINADVLYIGFCIMIGVLVAWSMYVTMRVPSLKTDDRMVKLSDAVLDLEARLGRVEQTNEVLLRALQAGHVQTQGVSVPLYVPDVPVIPLPAPVPPRRIGDVPGDIPLGDTPAIE